MMSNALFKYLMPNNTGLGDDDVPIATYIMPLPSQPMPITVDITTLLGGLLYPFAASFLIPVSVCVCVCVCVCLTECILIQWIHVVTYTPAHTHTHTHTQVFMSSLVKDKFEKHLIMMEQNGLSRWTYWLVTYLFNYMLYIPIAVEIAIVSFAFQIRLFTQVRLYSVLH